jgi:hypothetical protein
MPEIPAQLDHLVYAVPDLQAAVAELEDALGVALLPGGAHPAWGTRNAILPLSGTTYLEVIGPDPEAPRAGTIELFGIGGLTAPRLVTWAAKGSDLPALVASARERGVELGGVGEGRRVRADGSVLSWQLTDPLQRRAGGLVPFFIDWARSPHPAAAVKAEAELLGLSAEHPDPGAVAAQLRGLGIELDIVAGATPALVATLQTRDGAFDLR